MTLSKDTDPHRWVARRINDDPRPWAIITPDGPHGDEIVAGCLSERDANLLIRALRLTNPDYMAQMELQSGAYFESFDRGRTWRRPVT